MTIMLSLLLTALVFILAIYPLLKKKIPVTSSLIMDENLEELKSHRDTTYSMLKELDFDYQSGILSTDDYEELRNRYKQKAVNILKDMDGLYENTDTDDEIEKKVLELRKKKVGELQDNSDMDEIEKRILALRQHKGRFCTHCGARHDPNDRFCAQCGTKLFKEQK